MSSFEETNELANQQLAEHQASLIVQEIEAGVRPVAALRVRIQQNSLQDIYFSRLNSSLLAALADRDVCLDQITLYVDDPDERFVVDEHRTPVRLALAAAELRNGNRQQAEEMFFDAGASSHRSFGPEDLDRINGFVAEWTRQKLGEVATSRP